MIDFSVFNETLKVVWVTCQSNDQRQWKVIPFFLVKDTHFQIFPGKRRLKLSLRRLNKRRSPKYLKEMLTLRQSEVLIED